MNHETEVLKLKRKKNWDFPNAVLFLLSAFLE
jgi:hypothetical protein